MLRFIYIFWAIGVLSFSVKADDSTKIKRVKILPVPAFGYSPETRTYVGAVVLFTFNLYKDTLTRTSNAKVEFNYTWNKQMILEAEWNYFLKEEKWFTRGKLHYSKFPDLYYGIGSATPDSNKLGFNSDRIVAEMGLLKKVGDRLFSGGFVKYIDYKNVSYTSDAVLYPELVNASTIGVGYTILSDKRNSLLTPTKGSYVNFNISYNAAKKSYVKLFLDVRGYKTWNNKYTLAGRFVHDVNIGEPPFYDYAFLGGDRFVRGYYFGRYRDKVLSSIQAEFRAHIVWRIGLAAFGGLSSIYPEAYEIQTKNAKYNYGLGLRFLMDKKDRTNLRLDYAIGQDGNDGFYVSFGESF
jgi:outer membrane protein assembly factor BamA